MATIQTVGELKQWLVDNDVSDDTELWIGETVTEGGLDYFDRCRKFDAEVALHTETFGILLPTHQQKTQTGVVIW